MPPRYCSTSRSELGQGLSEYLPLFAPVVTIIAMGILTILVSGAS